MNIDRVRAIADAVLYEGYILYPYRPSAVKNRQRWTFGGVFPHAYARLGGETSSMRTEVLLRAEPCAEIDVMARFLHTQIRQIGKVSDPTAEFGVDLAYDPVAALEVEGKQFVSWDEAVERQVRVTAGLVDILGEPRRVTFCFPVTRKVDAIRSSEDLVVGGIIRSCKALEGRLDLSATDLGDGIFRLSIAIENTTPLLDPDKLSRMEAQGYALLSTHMIMHARHAEFVSLLEPPEHLLEAAGACINHGIWPVLVGEDTARDTLLSSPIILYDYPKIAPESQGPFFDGAEIDELLTLRVLTLTDEEKREMAAADPLTRNILERCETLNKDQFGALHGAFRPCGATGAEGMTRSADGEDLGLTVGLHVRLAPRARGDIMDIALKGKIAVIESIERDFDGRTHIAVTVLDDPGSDLGAAGFPGHRFFFSPQEVEPMVDGELS
ncbi:hypothetical protein [Methylosinus sporium]|uniref:hypothetical protein n=1 Tax=Methylosinus sporium TaxID=428 RepID=UPI000D58DEC8|nr:hypothetical protein [Methylosinus sporium]PWB89068.1 hypothetical protein C5688_17885 [Methylocystis sp. MitZ-2018]